MEQPNKPSLFSGYRLVIIEGARDANGVYRQRSRCSSYYPTMEDLFRAMLKHPQTWQGKNIRIIYNR